MASLTSFAALTTFATLASATNAGLFISHRTTLLLVQTRGKKTAGMGPRVAVVGLFRRPLNDDAHQSSTHLRSRLVYVLSIRSVSAVLPI